MIHVIMRGSTPLIDTTQTMVVPARTGQHALDNALDFHPVQGGPIVRFKLMFVDRITGCIIMVRYLASGQRACQLLQTGSTVDGPIPPHCQHVYRISCPGNSIYPYSARWKNLLRYRAR
ncbi:uncharacterized protein LOC144134980 [Amblyomma americanum]